MQDERRVLFQTSVGCDILRQTGDLSAAADSTRGIESQVANLRDELARIEAETSRLHDEAVEMRRRVAEDSERFARARAARDRLARINEDFEAMFVRKAESPPAEIAAMLCNRDENRRLLERKKSELEVVRQITRRMKFYEQNH
jgi:septal ring factor EnvC (AmiA/AmiB activator)